MTEKPGLTCSRVAIPYMVHKDKINFVQHTHSSSAEAAAVQHRFSDGREGGHCTRARAGCVTKYETANEVCNQVELFWPHLASCSGEKRESCTGMRVEIICKSLHLRETFGCNQRGSFVTYRGNEGAWREPDGLAT